MTTRQTLFQSYLFPMILLSSLVLGGAVGYFGGQSVQCLKPLGDIFLNLIFTTIVPLIFFNVASAIARAGMLGKLGRLFSSMTLIFLLTSVVAASLMIVVVQMFPPAQGVHLTLLMPENFHAEGALSQLAGIFTVGDFSQLLTHRHMLALIMFSILIGLATIQIDNKKSGVFIAFLQSGEAVLMRVFSLIMLYAPIGFFAYFAVLVSDFGPKLLQSYVRVAAIYYVFAIAYFFLAYTLYAYCAAKTEGIGLFWKNIFLPAATSLATCSSAASIPANIMATQAMGVSPDIAETVVPLGSLLHKDGSVIGGVIKIAFLFGVFHWSFTGASVLMTALAVSLLVGTVMGAIPSGGMLGELLILSVYGFPPSALMVIAAISIIIDPIATMLNVTGNSVCSMMIARLVDGKNWRSAMR
jgi:Na+/H+-dicarboxylate symporter